MKLLALVAAAVGLGPDASEETVTAAFEGVAADILTSSGVKSLAGVPGAVEALKTANDALKEKADKADELAAKLAAFEAAQLAADLDSLVKQAVEDGRLSPAKREAFVAKAQKRGIEWAKDTIEMMPHQIAKLGAPPPNPPEITPAKLDDELKASLAKAGLTEQNYLDAQARGHV
jgi:phage I-like protein